MTAAAAGTITLSKAFELRKADDELNAGGALATNGVSAGQAQFTQATLKQEGGGSDGFALRKRRRVKMIDPEQA